MNKLGVDTYELDYWLVRLGSSPVERLVWGESLTCYETDKAHVFKLQNEKYALVTEEGCSCYSPGDANIDLYPTKALVLAAFKTWLSYDKRRKEYTNAE